MQDFMDEQDMQIKKIAKFELDNEIQLNKLSVYDFLFHLQTLLAEQESA